MSVFWSFEFRALNLFRISRFEFRIFNMRARRADAKRKDSNTVVQTSLTHLSVSRWLTPNNPICCDSTTTAGRISA